MPEATYKGEGRLRVPIDDEHDVVLPADEPVEVTEAEAKVLRKLDDVTVGAKQKDGD